MLPERGRARVCVRQREDSCSSAFHTDKVEEILTENLVTSCGGFAEDLSAPLGFDLISGAEDDGGGGAEARSALLRTACPHRRKNSVSPLGHSHH